MTDIGYLAPRTLDEAVGAFAAAQGAARILAGGTDLLVQMRAGTVRPGLIVDIKKIAEMTGIEETADGGFRIGAAVSGAVLRRAPALGKAWPGVVEAVNLIGSTQMQGRATPGGNLCNASPAGDSVPAHDRGRRRRHGRRAERAARDAGRSVLAGAGPDRPGPGEIARRLHPAAAAAAVPAMPTCASFRATRWTSPWSASASA